ncbi:GlxA family transcriptional regulator [Nonomuraea sp. NPDC050556]|uniref:GlxA family transcriptional regulator n=1 Tax=Nonomuraea sp. NPDC050556 TaxID=3364369 RepID=UPI0037B0A430
MSQESSHRVVVIVDAGSNPFELGVATELFGLRRPELGRDWYDFRLCAPGGQAAMHRGLFTLSGVADLDAAAEADTLIVPNRPDPYEPPHPGVLAAVRAAHERGARLVSFCTGTFVLAEAGLLDGRPAATHWRWADAFTARYPRVDLRPDVLFVDDGDVLTAAGSAAALDLGLHLIRTDHGAEIASAVGRRLVFATHRDGGQRQFVEHPVPPTPDASLAPILEFAREHLSSRLTVPSLAARAGVSSATLHRRFLSQLGVTPLAWLTSERVTHARRLLETTDRPIDAVARLSGLGTATNLRTHLHTATGLTPTAYRTRFTQKPTPAGALLIRG